MRYVLFIDTGPTELPGITFAECLDGDNYQCAQGQGGDKEALAALFGALATVLEVASDAQASRMLASWRVEGDES
jgi:hypothetical protein